MPVTLEDIATATGFDKSTVSVTLRDLPRASRFSQETRDRIHAAAAELGYRPNFFAQQLSGKKPRMLMLCVNYLRDPFAMMVAEGFEARAAELGLRVLITALRDRQDPLDLHRDVLGVQGVPAMALVGGDPSKLSDDSLRALARDGVKIVLVNRFIGPTPADGGRRPFVHVGADELGGSRLMAEHIYAQGAQDVWVLGGMHGSAFQARLAGFSQVAADHRRPAPRVLNCRPLQGLDWSGGAATTVAAALAVSRPPQAILAVSDVLALGAERALAEAGLVVGRDVAVTGYDDGVYAQCAWPPLTTVRLPMAGMGRAAADALFAMLDVPDVAPPDVVLPVELVVRESGVLAPPTSAGRPSPDRN
jgi:LacI family transcriptional regulator